MLGYSMTSVDHRFTEDRQPNLPAATTLRFGSVFPRRVPLCFTLFISGNVRNLPVPTGVRRTSNSLFHPQLQVL